MAIAVPGRPLFPAQSVLAWKVILILLHVATWASTLFRLIHRFRRRKLWWDDYILIGPLVMDICLFVEMILRFKHNFGATLTMIEQMWFSQFFVLSVIWWSRISLSLSIARIFPPHHIVRRNGLLFAGVCFLLYLTALISVTLICKGGKDGHPFYLMNPVNCQLIKPGVYVHGIVIMSLDIPSDLLLCVYPLYVLWRIKVPRGARRLILITFSASVLTLIAAVIYGVFGSVGLNLGPSSALLHTVVAHIEVVVALLVCNLLVVTMYFYRLIRRWKDPNHDDDDDDDDTTSVSAAESKSAKPDTFALTELQPDSDASNLSAPRQGLGRGDFNSRYSGPATGFRSYGSKSEWTGPPGLQSEDFQLRSSSRSPSPTSRGHEKGYNLSEI